MALSEFLYSKRQTKISERDWLNDHIQKAKILTVREFLNVL